VGELVTCPLGTARWIAAGQLAGSLAAPDLTRAVVGLRAATRVSGFLQLAYARTGDAA
jgi:hypothetical protein